MEPTMRHRGKIVFVATTLGGLAIAARVANDHFQRADSYREAAAKYGEFAKAYEGNIQRDGVVLFSSCYGERWDSYTLIVERDLSAHADDRAYRQAKASHFRGLKEKYEQASSRPWASL